MTGVEPSRVHVVGKQYGRRVRVTVGQDGRPGTSWTQLRVGFNIKRSDKKKPDSSTIIIYGLNEHSIALIKSDGAKVWLQAGYSADSQPPLIFAGDIDEVEDKTDGVKSALEITASDGGKAYREAFTSITWGGPLTSLALITRLADEMGLTLSSIPPDLPTLQYTDFGHIGPTRDALSRILGDVGASWSIQGGQLLVTKVGQAQPNRAFLLSSNTGLVGSVEKVKKKKGNSDGVKFRALLNSELLPKRLVVLDSRKASGTYRIRTVTLNGDTRSGEFYADIEAKQA